MGPERGPTSKCTEGAKCRKTPVVDGDLMAVAAVPWGCLTGIEAAATTKPAVALAILKKTSPAHAYERAPLSSCTSVTSCWRTRTLLLISEKEDVICDFARGVPSIRIYLRTVSELVTALITTRGRCVVELNRTNAR
jgi:hypothetical protein